MEGGRTETPVATIKASDPCAFGRWLKTEFQPAATQPSDVQRIDELHRKPHPHAGTLAELGSTGSYHHVSTELVSGGRHM